MLDLKTTTLATGTIIAATTANTYRADIATATDYYAFGQPIQERTYNASAYRYGFNGKEKDNELYGEGNAYDFGARINDPRLGRWLSLDPLAAKYPPAAPSPPTSTSAQPRCLLGMISASNA